MEKLIIGGKDKKPKLEYDWDKENTAPKQWGKDWIAMLWGPLTIYLQTKQ